MEIPSETKTNTQLKELNLAGEKKCKTNDNCIHTSQCTGKTIDSDGVKRLNEQLRTYTMLTSLNLQSEVKKKKKKKKLNDK